MATVGIDCQVLIDGAGYFVEPRSYAMHRIRLRKAGVLLDGTERYVDLGPGKRVWRMILLCLNELSDYSGTMLPFTGLALRERLRASYEKTATIPFVDLDGGMYAVHFDDYEEHVRDPRTQLRSPGYHVAVALVEA